MRWPAIYLLAGFAYVLWALYGNEAGALMRATWARRGIQGAEMGGLAFSVVFWPIVIVMGLVIRSSPYWLDRHATWFRRTHLDREGMFEPQMPAPRCHIHGLLTDTKVPCNRCGATVEIVECSACIAAWREREKARGRVRAEGPDPIYCDDCDGSEPR